MVYDFFGVSRKMVVSSMEPGAFFFPSCLHGIMDVANTMYTALHVLRIDMTPWAVMPGQLEGLRRG